MKYSAAALIAGSIAVQHVSATFDWGSAKRFSNPSNTDNECTEDQKLGFDWSDLLPGSVGSYKGFDFSGFESAAANGTLRTRSLGRRTGSEGNAIKGNIRKGSEAAPKISCEGDKSFSIVEFKVATSAKTDVDFHYGMPDGSTCKHTHSCSGETQNVPNSQCGGAISVSFGIPDYGSEDECDMEIEHVGFDCEPAVVPVPPPTEETPEVPPTSSESVASASSSSVESTTSTESAIPSSIDTSLIAEPATSSEPPVPIAATSSTATVDATSLTSSEIATTEPPASQVVTTEVVFTTTTLCPVTVSTFSNDIAIVSTFETLSTTVVTSTITLCTACTEAPPTTLSTVAPAEPTSSETVDAATTSEVPAATTSEVPAAPVTSSVPEPASPEPETPEPETPEPETPEPESPEPGTPEPGTPEPETPEPETPEPETPDAPCPPVLPSCLNTWLSLVPQCTSNSDASCYCPSKEFTDAIISCVQAWGSSAEELSAALSYFTGICASSVGENPAIVTAIPTTITLCPTASLPPPVAATSAIGVPAPAAPGVTEIPIPTEAPPAPVPTTVIVVTQADTSSTVTTTITVPQVSFVTDTAAPLPATGADSAVQPQAATVSVGLVPVAVVTSSAYETATFLTSSVLVNGSIATATGSSPIAVFTGAAGRVDRNGGVAFAALSLGLLVLLF